MGSLPVVSFSDSVQHGIQEAGRNVKTVPRHAIRVKRESDANLAASMPSSKHWPPSPTTLDTHSTAVVDVQGRATGSAAYPKHTAPSHAEAMAVTLALAELHGTP